MRKSTAPPADRRARTRSRSRKRSTVTSERFHDCSNGGHDVYYSPKSEGHCRSLCGNTGRLAADVKNGRAGSTSSRLDLVGEARPSVRASYCSQHGVARGSKGARHAGARKGYRKARPSYGWAPDHECFHPRSHGKRDCGAATQDASCRGPPDRDGRAALRPVGRGARLRRAGGGRRMRRPISSDGGRRHSPTYPSRGHRYVVR